MHDTRFWIAASVLTVLWIISVAAALHAAATAPQAAFSDRTTRGPAAPVRAAALALGRSVEQINRIV